MQGSWQNYALLNTTPVQVDANGSIFSGTGFFVLWQTQEGTALFLVSNKHVLRSKQSAVSVSSPSFARIDWAPLTLQSFAARRLSRSSRGLPTQSGMSCSRKT